MRRWLFLLLALLSIAEPANAQQPALDRGWSAAEVEPGTELEELLVAPSGLGESAAVYVTPALELRARVRRAGAWGLPTTILSRAYVNSTAIDGSVLHGAVVASTADGKLRIAQAAPGGDVVVTRTLPAAHANFSYDRPIVQFGPLGEVVVLYIGFLPGDAGPRVMAVIRDRQGEWGDPVSVTGPGPVDSRYARSVAIGADGTIVVGLVYEDRVRVATRLPGAEFTLSEPIGGQLPQYKWEVPRVGIDAAGTVVAAWSETVEGRQTSPVKVAFRAPLAGSFGPPANTGLLVQGGSQVEMGVSLPGEVVLVAQTYGESDCCYFIDGLQAVSGLTHLQRVSAPVRLTEMWGDYPSFDMNPRGDAVVVYDECCPLALRARRRLPLAGFGPVVEVQPPIPAQNELSGGRWMTSGHMDEFGNARASWLHWSAPEGGGEVTVRYFVGSDGPLLDAPLPEVGDVGDRLPPVLFGPPVDEEKEVALPVDPPAVDAPVIDPRVVEDIQVPPVADRPVAPLAPTVPAAAARDLVAPRLSLRTSVPDRRRRVRVRVACDETCGVRLALRDGRRLGPAVSAVLRPGVGTKLTLRAPRGWKSLRVEGAVGDAAGNFSLIDRPVRRR